MPEVFNAFSITANGPAAEKAAGVLADALAARGVPTATPNGTVITLAENAGFDSDDCFAVCPTPQGFLFSANGVRGLIYAVGLFLRKTVYANGTAALICPIEGTYRPKKAIRGHQLGYRPINNTYDAWDVPDFERYMTELMFFGMNTVEFIPLTEKNSLMKYEGPEMTAMLCEKARALELDISLWIPNGNAPEAEELTEREALFKMLPHVDAVFIPGSDPGDLPAGTLIDRCKKIYRILTKYHPQAKLWVSAQAPHSAPGWGEAFLEALLANDAGEICGVIQGPNRAFTTRELRERLPLKYPLRFYPDVTHNLRCEHPVHFKEDDWHYAFAAAFSRESVNPRPTEYARLFASVSPYTAGSVTYSDGVNDDVNKAVWCALEWDDTLNAEDICADYARAYLYGYDTNIAAAAILLLEQNWAGSPAERVIDRTYELVNSLKQKENCWRMWQLVFRAAGDKYVKERFLADTAAAGFAKAMLLAGDSEEARKALAAPEPAHVGELRKEIQTAARALYDTAGMQLSVQEFGASGWERGAVLDTVDLPLTDRQWLLHVIERAKDAKTPARAAALTEVRDGEFFFSVALHGLQALGTPQTPDFYMNVQADRPNVNNGSLPALLFKAFDHYSLRAKIPGFLPGRAYILRAVYLKPDARFLKEHTVTVNGVKLPPPVPDAAFTCAFLPEPFYAYKYRIPPAAMRGDEISLLIEEPLRGFQIAAFYIIFEEENA